MKRAGLTEARLVAAAANLADDSGLDAVTISALARHFAVQPASLYSHVAGLDRLLDLTTAFALQQIADRLAEDLPGKSERAALVALGDVHRDFAREHPGQWQAAQRRLSPEAPAAAAGLQISRATRAIVAGYGLSANDEVHAVRLLSSAINGFIALEAGGGFDHSGPAPAESWSRVLDAVDAALRGWPAAVTSASPNSSTTTD